MSSHEIEVKRVKKRVLLQFRALALELLRNAPDMMINSKSHASVAARRFGRSGLPSTPLMPRLRSSAQLCRMIFNAMDTRGDGNITFSEFRLALDSLEIFLSVPACRWFFSDLDREGTGTITFLDFELAMKENVFNTLETPSVHSKKLLNTMIEERGYTPRDEKMTPRVAPEPQLDP